MLKDEIEKQLHKKIQNKKQQLKKMRVKIEIKNKQDNNKILILGLDWKKIKNINRKIKKKKSKERVTK